MEMFQSLLIILCVSSCCGLPYLEGWNYINLHCRDNNNKPVDWWYIYKPPGPAMPYEDYGRAFSYITPDTDGKWVASPVYINGNSMLHNTLSPMFRQTYADYLAMVAYEQRNSNETHKGSASHGMMMASDQGGVWIGHTVPGLPDLNKDRPTFPAKESANGHLIVCLSLGLVALNEVALAIRKVNPHYTGLKVPQSMKKYLPKWKFTQNEMNNKVKSIQKVIFPTRSNTIRVAMMARSPGDDTCLYEKFAREKKIILDVYGSSKKFMRTTCNRMYGVRNINTISLKHVDRVVYINKGLDRTKFAVSTAANWQRRGDSVNQFWTCISDFDTNDISSKGGLLMCVEDYRIWLIFDNFKIKEPLC